MHVGGIGNTPQGTQGAGDISPIPGDATQSSNEITAEVEELLIKSPTEDEGGNKQEQTHE